MRNKMYEKASFYKKVIVKKGIGELDYYEKEQKSDGYAVINIDFFDRFHNTGAVLLIKNSKGFMPIWGIGVNYLLYNICDIKLRRYRLENPQFTNAIRSGQILLLSEQLRGRLGVQVDEEIELYLDDIESYADVEK